MLTAADVPDHLLSGRHVERLIKWLDDHDLEVSLYDLDHERRRRGITPPMRTR